MTDGSPPQRDLAGVLHDVSNALTVLLGWVGEARCGSAEEAAYALTVIEQRARVARDLARQAIGEARIEESTTQAATTAEVAASLRVAAQRAGVRLDVVTGEAGATLAGALDLSQVLTNLVLNALAFAPQGSVVEVHASADDATCTWLVADGGPGVPDDLRARIFHGASRRPGGAGVGLRHARALARSAGGDVELLPRTAGEGARFRVTWPRLDAIPRPPVSVPARERGLEGLRVLVVEDDAAVTQLLETALEARGAEVTLAGTAAALGAAIDGGAVYDVALIDLSPIAGQVEAALGRIAAASPGIDLVLITGSADRLPDGIAAMKLVRKPFEVSEILASLKKRS